MSGFNGTSAIPKPRYIVQWVTEYDPKQSGTAMIRVLGYCVRDRGTTTWSTVFEHESKQVCEKLANILNEGA